MSMNIANKKVENELTNILKEVFANYNISELSEFKKRQLIFSFLCENFKYDFELLAKIYDNAINGGRNSRDPVGEINDAIFNKKGICSSISQCYKLLLGKVGIKSICVICDNGMKVKHQLTLVYDNTHRTYSFDDITSVIVGIGCKNDFFDYNLKQANAKNQGNINVFQDKKFVVLPEDYINSLIGRDSKITSLLSDMPTNIMSVKEKERLISNSK